jgi:hypothetical protein
VPREAKRPGPVLTRDLAGAVAEAQRKTADLFQAPYRAEWSGEFEETEAANKKLMLIIPMSLVLIFVLLYLSFHSFLDALAVERSRSFRMAALCLAESWSLFAKRFRELPQRFGRVGHRDPSDSPPPVVEHLNPLLELNPTSASTDRSFPSLPPRSRPNGVRICYTGSNPGT